jgi:hypothetical protein
MTTLISPFDTAFTSTVSFDVYSTDDPFDGECHAEVE